MSTGAMKKLLARLPWRKPRLADQSEERQARIRAMMLGAGAPLKPASDGRIHIEVERIAKEPKQ